MQCCHMHENHAADLALANLKHMFKATVYDVVILFSFPFIVVISSELWTAVNSVTLALGQLL